MAQGDYRLCGFIYAWISVDFHGLIQKSNCQKRIVVRRVLSNWKVRTVRASDLLSIEVFLPNPLNWPPNSQIVSEPLFVSELIVSFGNELALVETPEHEFLLRTLAVEFFAIG